jgi:hypothetical protein
MSKLRLIALTVFLSGCASTSVVEVRKTETPTLTTCSQTSVREAAERIQTGWGKCFVKDYSHTVFAGGAPITFRGKSNMSIVVEPFEKGVSVVLTHTPPIDNVTRMLLVADIQQTESCPAEVVVRGANMVWRSNAEHTKLWLSDPNARPSGLACL